MDSKIYWSIKTYRPEILTTPYEVEYDGIHGGIYFINDLWFVDIE